jgi:hypothetical protein
MESIVRNSFQFILKSTNHLGRHLQSDFDTGGVLWALGDTLITCGRTFTHLFSHGGELTKLFRRMKCYSFSLPGAKPQPYGRAGTNPML